MNTETCRSNFIINFVLLLYAFIGILTKINQNERHEHKNKPLIGSFHILFISTGAILFDSI